MIRIILLEDEFPERILFKNVLKDLEFSGGIYTAENINVLINIILEIKKTASPEDLNILFLDMILPCEMGTEAVRKIRLNELPGTNFYFFLSGHTGESAIKEAYQLGTNGYIFKPSIYDELSSIIQLVLTFCKWWT